MTPTRPFALLSLALLVSACAGPAGPPPWEVENPLRPLPASPLGLGEELAGLAEAPTPAGVRLGRWLFHDRRLSSDGSVSCSSCHRREHGFSEPEPVSTGVAGRRGRRKAPPVLNMAFAVYPAFFRDGRAASLEEQALGPLTSALEMDNAEPELLVERLTRDGAYAPYFAEAFGDEAITIERLTRALADYERTLLSGDSPFDRWQAGDETAVSPAVKLGSELFFGRARCVTCHLGDSFTDWRFHVTGVGWDPRRAAFGDRGRAEVTGAPGDEGAFKTPTLRDVSRRAPYMHDGSIPSLRAVVELYDLGGVAGAPVSPLMQPLGLSDSEIDALVAFLEALEGSPVEPPAPGSLPRGR